MDARTTTAIAAALAEAEDRLQFVITESAKGADYGISKAASAVAETIHAIRDQLKTTDPPARVASAVAVSLAPKSVHHAARRPAYPSFHRRGDQLVRAAWSKRGKKEYSHKAPYAVVKLLARAMAELGKDGRVFTTDQLLPITLAEGAEVPDYQSYVGISFLKKSALIDQHGRQGYSIRRPAELDQALATAWQNLPEK